MRYEIKRASMMDWEYIAAGWYIFDTQTREIVAEGISTKEIATTMASTLPQ